MGLFCWLSVAVCEFFLELFGPGVGEGWKISVTFKGSSIADVCRITGGQPCSSVPWL